MTVRRLDESTGDIVTRGRQFITGDNTQEEIAQTIKTRLRLFSGEYFRDVTDGTPWFQVILDKNATLAARDAAIKQRIVQTDGVLQLVTFETDYDISSRGFTVSAQVLTAVGLASIQLNESIQ
jgi:hypothetical protein